MSYIVPLNKPKHCNLCPFGICRYSLPFTSARDCSVDIVDGKMNRGDTYGYNCNVEFEKKGKYIHTVRAKINKNLKRPAWCPLSEPPKES